jgi:hypothetical protein
VTPDEKDIRPKGTAGAAGGAATAGGAGTAGPAGTAPADELAPATRVTPETCGLQLECPVCGWKAEGIRCVRCGALKIRGCDGSCGNCGGCPALG